MLWLFPSTIRYLVETMLRPISTSSALQRVHGLWSTRAVGTARGFGKLGPWAPLGPGGLVRVGGGYVFLGEHGGSDTLYSDQRRIAPP